MMPPPARAKMDIGASPFAIVKPEIDDVLPLLTVNILKWFEFCRFTVSFFAPGPLMAMLLESGGSSVLRAMTPMIEKFMAKSPAPVWALTQVMAPCREQSFG